MMKKLLSLLAITLFLNSCDDGDLTQETIDFASAKIQNCNINNLIYKLKDKEALILEIPITSFVNEPTTVNEPRTININETTNRVVYRFYDGVVTENSICNAIPQRTPIAIDQWNATAGTIAITTTPIKTTDATNNSTKITGYNHNIALKNITFAIKNGEQVFKSLPFGDYITTATALPFNFEKILTKCTKSNIVYDYKSSEAIMLDINPELIVNAVTAINRPRTGLITTTTNKLTYRLFLGILNADYFCNAVTPITPALNQEWIAAAGTANTNGIVEVTTTTNGPNAFKHTITLKKVTLEKGNSSFTLGDSYLLGELTTTN